MASQSPSLGGSSSPCSLDWSAFNFLTIELTSYVVLVSIIQLFYSSVTESQLPHPVNPSSYTCWQTKVCTTCSCMEAISCKTVGTANTQNTVKINTMYSCKCSNYFIFKKKEKKKKILYLTLGLVHYHQKKHHLYELDRIPVRKKKKQTRMTNLSIRKCNHHSWDMCLVASMVGWANGWTKWYQSFFPTRITLCSPQT